MTTSSPVYWGWTGPASTFPSTILDLLCRIRRGDDIMTISSHYPEMTTAQLALAKHLQAQEAEINQLYKNIQRLESLKSSVERELTSSLIRTSKQD